MRRLVIIAIIAALPVSIGVNAQTIGLPDKPQAQDGADRVHGRFVAMGGRLREHRIACVQCHGMDGLAIPGGAVPRLDGQAAWYLYKALNDYATGVRFHEIMTPVALQLDEHARRDVAAYYSSLQSLTVETPELDDASLRQRGGAISAVGVPERGVAACQSCHGEAGRGDPPTVPVLAGQYAPYTVLQLERWKEGRRDGDPLNVMQQIAVQMSEEDIRAAAAYFEAVRRDGP
ncbi:MAG TPA: c-type cytochrome [Rhizobiaceae bacterium]|nr:c-type cytochrome [Rhizobiaceae bacterium]